VLAGLGPGLLHPIGSPINSHDDWEDWHALLAEASVRTARVHDARHTAATLLLEQGIDIRVVQQILGHSLLSQTQRYTHVTAELSRHAADIATEWMGSARCLWPGSSTGSLTPTATS
jgi:integrase